MPDSELNAYLPVSIVLETIVAVDALLDSEIELASKKLGCKLKQSYSLFGEHAIHGQPRGGVDWNREFSLIHNGCDTHFLFDLCVDHNDHRVEVNGSVEYDGTYGYETFRNTSQIVTTLQALKSTSIVIVQDMFSQLVVDFAESLRLAKAAPTKAGLRKE